MVKVHAAGSDDWWVVMTNYALALQANREDLLETIANLESERRKVDKAIGDLETTKEAITKAIAAMKQLVSNYDAEIARN